MPLRHSRIRAAQYARLGSYPAAYRFPAPAALRSFHATSIRRDDADASRSHYEILNVSPDASASDIKKAFYTLSKSHHPDHNQDDPAAPQRFMRISEAYGVLSHADKRARYDRDVLHRHPAPHAHAHAHKGSYHSTGPAGGRPPSGLSKRRGTFTGPPPSFFRSGGWGAHGAKRKAAHEESTGGAGAGGGGGGAHAGGDTSGQWGGMGPGQDPFGHQDEVPHFDREQHARTAEARSARRAGRPGERGFQADDMGVAQGFFVISGILLCVVGLPMVLFGGWWKTDRRREKKLVKSSG